MIIFLPPFWHWGLFGRFIFCLMAKFVIKPIYLWAALKVLQFFIISCGSQGKAYKPQTMDSELRYIPPKRKYCRKCVEALILNYLIYFFCVCWETKEIAICGGWNCWKLVLGNRIWNLYWLQFVESRYNWFYQVMLYIIISFAPPSLFCRSGSDMKEMVESPPLPKDREYVWVARWIAWRSDGRRGKNPN